MTFTWQGGADDPPPDKVVIAEEGNTSVSSSAVTPGTYATTVTCDNALDFPFKPGPTYGPAYGASGTSIGTRYQIKDQPGQEFTITCSPSATVEGPASTSTSSNNSSGLVKVQYKATATPLEIVLDGGIGSNRSKRFLIGQQVSGSVSSGGLQVVPDSCDWSADAGSPFSDYQVVWTDENSPTSATFIELGTQTQSTVTFHFKQAPAKGTVANVSTPVTLAVPAGALPAEGLTATLKQECRIDIPNKTISVYIGTVRGVPDPAVPEQIALYDAVKPDGNVVGLYWRGTVTTPIEYGSGGGWNVTQLVKPTHLRTQNGVEQKLAANGVLALDTVFGYDAIFPAVNTDDGVLQGSQDTPSSGAWNAGTSFMSANTSFNDYMMYLPNGTGSCFVPLRQFNWFWAGRAQPNGSTGVWQVSHTNQGWSLGAEYPDHPEWTTNAGQGLNWVNK